MLYQATKRYLIEKLKAAGLKTKPYTTMKTLEKSQESHIGAVLFDTETVSRNGSKTFYKDQEGARKKRRKVFDRDLSFIVLIGEYNDDVVEALYASFLEHLDEGLYVDGNYVPLEVEEAAWIDEDDSVLRAKVSVRVRITFHGGLYRDTGFAPLSQVEVETVTKQGKEPADGEQE